MHAVGVVIVACHKVDINTKTAAILKILRARPLEAVRHRNRQCFAEPLESVRHRNRWRCVQSLEPLQTGAPDRILEMIWQLSGNAFSTAEH